MGFLCFLNYGLGNNFRSTCKFPHYTSMLPTLVEHTITAILSNVKYHKTLMSMGLEGKAEEEAEDAIRGTSVYAMS